MTPLVSIIVPVFNAELWLADTLRSALAQTWKRKEIIVVDDGSTDKSLNIARSFESSEVAVISLVHAGQTVALNAGLKQAQGELIQYLDADDLLASNKIEVQAARLLTESKDAISTSRWGRFYDPDPSNTRMEEHADFQDYDAPIDWLLQSWNGRGTMPPVAWLLPRSVVDRCGGWNENLTLSNDTEYFTRAVLTSSRIAYCPEAHGYYRSGNQTLSGRRDRKALESFFEVCRLCVSHLIGFEDSARTRRACASLWQFYVYWTYPEAPDLIKVAEQQVAEMGGTDLRLKVSLPLELLSGIIGWKGTKRIQRAYYSLRY